MSDTAIWLGEVHEHVETAQSVLEGVSRGLAAAETAEAAAERAAPVLKKVLAVLIVAAVGFAVYRLVSGRQRSDPGRPEWDETNEPEDPPAA